MQKIKTDPPGYTTDCILLREKLLLQQSVHRPLENLLCSGQPATLVLTDIKTGNVPLKSSLWIKWFLINLSKHYGHRPGRFQ